MFPKNSYSSHAYTSPLAVLVLDWEQGSLELFPLHGYVRFHVAGQSS